MTDSNLLNYLDTTEFKTAASNSSRLVAKLKTAVEKKELYELHQIFRTVYFRFVNHKDKVRALRKLLYQGATYLISADELVSAQDIGNIFLETAAKDLTFHRESGGATAEEALQSSSIEYHKCNGNETLDFQICKEASSILVQLPSTDIGQPRFKAEIFKHLTNKLVNKELLHNVIAADYWQRKDFVNSRYHFLHCANEYNAHDVANLLVEYQTSSANQSEVDLFVTQFVLQYLCLQDPIDNPDRNRPWNSRRKDVSHPRTRQTIKKIADDIFTAYTAKHPSLLLPKGPFPTYPLLNFMNFIISILDGVPKQEGATFTTLCNLYKPSWTMDPNYANYLERIGMLYFGVVDRQKQMQSGGGMFNNLLMSLFDNSDDEEEGQDERNEEPTPRQSGRAVDNYASNDDLD